MIYRLFVNSACFFLILFISHVSFGQNYGFEWIQEANSDVNSPAIKLKVVEEGVYRVYYSDFQNFNVSPGSINTNKLQLWRKGVQQSLMVNDGGDGTLNTGEYIEFYAKGNDGSLDKELYYPQSLQPHEQYSLYSDTANYFLTWNPAVPNKRTSNINGVSGSYAVPKNYHTKEVLQLYTDKYWFGRKYLSVKKNGNWEATSALAFGDEGEGWFSNKLGTSTVRTVAGLEDIYTGGSENAIIEVMLVGTDKGTHGVDISYKTSSQGSYTTLISGETFLNYDVLKKSFVVPASNIKDASNDGLLQIKIDNTGNKNIALAYIKIKAPQEVAMVGSTGKFMFDSTSSQLSITLQNTNSSFFFYDISEEGSFAKITAEYFSGSNEHKMMFNHLSSKEVLYVADNYLSVPGMEEADFLLPDSNVNYLIATHRSLLESANEYALYRQSASGGGYNVFTSTMEQFYNTFTYGDLTPLAIRRCAKYLKDKGNPEYLLLIGKGFLNTGENSDGYKNYIYDGAPYRKVTQSTAPLNVTINNQTIKMEDLVPSGGLPGSDVWYSARLDTSMKTWEPYLGTGRLSVLTNEEVTSYLDKVREYESDEDTTLWRKNVLHLEGGSTIDEINQISAAMEKWKNIAEGPYFGGNVKTIEKQTVTSNNVTEINVSDEVNEGLSLMTFYGHSSRTVTDIDIGFASNPINNYNNKGKYPLILLNGCNSGDCFSTGTFGEDWMRVPDKGAIGFIGHSELGFTGLLDTFSEEFYEVCYKDSAYYGETIGNIMKAVIARNGNGYANLTHSLHMVYQGDPALRLVQINKPDLEVNNGSLFLVADDSSVVTAVSDSFNLAIVVRNFGRYNKEDSFYVSVTRQYSGNTVQYEPVRYGSIGYQDTLYFKIQSKGLEYYGDNSFYVHIDYHLDSAIYNGEIDEYREDNNEASFNYFMPLSVVKPLFPLEYSIVNKQQIPIDFVAQSTDLLVEDREYFLELDTNPFFDPSGAFYRNATIQGSSVVTWPDITLPTLTDSTVYYWRVRYKNLAPGEDTLWGESSFIYIGNSSEGWAQAHHYQFKKDRLIDLVQNDDMRRWEFPKTTAYVAIRMSSQNYNTNKHYIALNGDVVWYKSTAVCGKGVRVMVIDNNTLKPVQLKSFNNPYIECETKRPNAAFERSNYHFNLDDATQRSDFNSFINSVPDSFYVVVSSLTDPKFNTWGLESTYQQFGASNYPASDGMSYAIVGKKGMPLGQAREFVTTDSIGEVVPITTYERSGKILSTLIGPATEWNSFLRNTVKDISEFADDYSYNIYGLNLMLQDTLLISDISNTQTDISSLKVDSFPYLKLEIHKSDSVSRTPPQLRNWLVVYKSDVPEGTIITKGYDYSEKKYYQGEKPVYKFKFRNISQNDFKQPIVVRYSIVSARENGVVGYDTISALKAGEEEEFSYELNTISLEGPRYLQVYVNPRLQPEHYFFNNQWQVPFEVETDKVNPLLDVTFDGVHIFDGDIISPDPLISMELKDDNEFVFKTDTMNVDVFWKYPGDELFTRIPLSSSNIQILYGSEDQDFKIEYAPKDLQDGIHTLSVQMTDAFGNKSGTFNYEISFEVINRTTISAFYPYPNPFSTKTRFAYTLTGGQQPDQFKIQIMTISGKIVREINQSEIGVLRIGKHLTDFAWDGTDEFGSKLGNGVYLYRVIAKIDGESIEERSTNDEIQSKAFNKHNWGKLYILR